MESLINQSCALLLLKYLRALLIAEWLTRW